MADTSKTNAQAVFEVLYEMRLAPRHQLEEAAKRIAALPLNNIALQDILALPRFSPTINDSFGEESPEMEVDNAMGRFLALSDVETVVTTKTDFNQPSSDMTPPLSVQEFKVWLNDQRMRDVSSVFHELVSKYRKAVEYK